MELASLALFSRVSDKALSNKSSPLPVFPDILGSLPGKSPLGLNIISECL